MTLDLRAINRLVQGDLFRTLWDKSNKEQQEAVQTIIIDLNIEGLRDWIHEAQRRDYRDMSYRDLLALCQRLRITNYSRMQKEEMVKALLERETHDKTSA